MARDDSPQVLDVKPLFDVDRHGGDTDGIAAESVGSH
jgi:hypothetical protein